VWCSYNIAYAIVVVRLMHRRILPGQQWRWYVEDVGFPVLAATGAAALMRVLVTASSIPMLVIELVLAGAFIQLVTCAVLPDVRQMIFGFIRGLGGGKVAL
jgi:hypothetical protein